MIELTHEFFEMLALAKELFDRDLLENVLQEYGNLELCSDNCYMMASDAIGWIFEKTGCYYNQDHEIDIWVFCDSRINDFCRLCQLYEQRWNLSEDDNPYRQRIGEAIHEAFAFGPYSYAYTYSWSLSSSERGKRRLLFFAGSEFQNLTDLPIALLDIRDAFEKLNRELELALSVAEKEVSVFQPPVERKEAA